MFLRLKYALSSRDFVWMLAKKNSYLKEEETSAIRVPKSKHRVASVCGSKDRAGPSYLGHSYMLKINCFVIYDYGKDLGRKSERTSEIMV